MGRILIVEDEESINELIQWNLELAGHQCNSIYDGAAAVDAVNNSKYDLVILDIMLPEMDGFEVIRQIRDTPVIFLTARGSLPDRLKGLSSGGDDYITKPFEMLELTARVEAVLRRTCQQEGSHIFKIREVHVDFDRREISVAGSAVSCTPQEFTLLEALIQHQNMALSREKLLELAWGYDYMGDTRTVDVHIQKLRKKLGLESDIVTVYKIGYRLEVPR